MVYWISHCVCCGFDFGLFVDQVFLALEFHIFSYTTIWLPIPLTACLVVFHGHLSSADFFPNFIIFKKFF